MYTILCVRVNKMKFNILFSHETNCSFSAENENVIYYEKKSKPYIRAHIPTSQSKSLLSLLLSESN